MLPDQVSNPESLTYESDALRIALRGPACCDVMTSLRRQHDVKLTSFAWWVCTSWIYSILSSLVTCCESFLRLAVLE